jgi:hypothetical protein
MSIFASKKAEPVVTGVDALRKAMLSWYHHSGLAMLAGNISGVGVTDLDDFAHGRRDLKPEILSALAREIFGGHIELD